MGNSYKYGFAIALAVLLTACNPQDQLGIGVEDDSETVSDTTIFSGLSFVDGKILISKAITRDLFGGFGSKYCFDNADSKYGCVKEDATGKPVFIRSIQFSLADRSKMFGISNTEPLEVTFPAATVTTAVPVVNPETGDFVFTKREKYRYDVAHPAGVKITSTTDSSCVPGTNGAVGFDDKPGYALTGLHVFEEGVDFSTSLTGLWAAQVDLKYYELNVSGGDLVPATASELSTSLVGLDTTALPGATLFPSYTLAANDVYTDSGTQLPRVITGFCLRSAKKSVNNQLIRVGLFGLRGVFYKGRFR